MGLITLQAVFTLFHIISGNREIRENCNKDISKPDITLDLTLTPFSDEVVLRNQIHSVNRSFLLCSHPTTPVQWEFISPDPGILDITQNTYWRNSTGYHFALLTITHKLDYKDNKNHLPLTLTCSSTGSRRSRFASRSYLYNKNFCLEPAKDGKDWYGPKPTPKIPEITTNAAKADCDLILRYRVNDEGNLEYKWETTQGAKANVIETITKTASPDYFKGLYANELQSPHCVKPLELTTGQICDDCKLVGSTAANEVLTGLIFRGEAEGKRSFIAKDTCGIDWDLDTALEKMIKISGPSVFFVNQTENVTCTVSPMFFALGTQLNLQRLLENNTSYFFDPYQTEEEMTRELTQSFVFHEECQQDSFVCSVPLLNFSRVISKTFNFSVVSSNTTSNTKMEQKQPQIIAKAVFGVGLGIGILICILIFGIICRRILLQRKNLKVVTEQELAASFSDKTSSGEFEFNATCDSEGYNESEDVPYDNWTINSEIVETGDFYVLARKGSVKLPTQTVEVTVKSLSKAEGVDDFKRFLYEINLIKYIGFHPNVVCQFATCVRIQYDAMIAMQLCSNGSLKKYLQTHGHKLNPVEEDSFSEDYENIFECPPSVHATCNGNYALKEIDLYNWSHQIANGMEFLVRKQVLHGDLRTSNVLLTSNKTAKISNFERSRHLGSDQMYKRTNRLPVHWRNLAIECLQTFAFSTKSDVWAFGVTIWEIFALGKTPYTEFTNENEYNNRLLGGFRLPKPLKSTSFVYQLMSHCWERNPADRPSFTHLKHHFGFIVKQLKNQNTQIEDQIL